MHEKKQPIQIFVAFENQTNACNMYKKMLIVIMQSGIFYVQLYDCISQSTFVSMSLNDLVICGRAPLHNQAKQARLAGVYKLSRSCVVRGLE